MSNDTKYGLGIFVAMVVFGKVAMYYHLDGIFLNKLIGCLLICLSVINLTKRYVAFHKTLRLPKCSGVCTRVFKLPVPDHLDTMATFSLEWEGKLYTIDLDISELSPRPQYGEQLEFCIDVVNPTNSVAKKRLTQEIVYAASEAIISICIILAFFVFRDNIFPPSSR